MKNFRCKILSLDFHYLKNTNHGHIDFLSPDAFLHDEEGNPNVFGIYGQNGSGKSTVILAFSVLQSLFQGDPIPFEAGTNISGWSNTADITLTLGLQFAEQLIEVTYRVDLGKKDDGAPLIQRESLSSKEHVKGWRKFLPVFTIGPDQDLDSIFGRDTNLKFVAHSLRKDTAKALTSNKKKKLPCSVLFDAALVQTLRNKNNPKIATLGRLLAALTNWAIGSFIVSSSSDQGCIDGLDLLPLRIRVANQTGGNTGAVPLDLSGTNSVPSEEFPLIEKVIDQFNIVVPAFLPHLHIVVRPVNDSKKANPGQTSFQLKSLVNGYEIPLGNESDGTKRIVSLCSSLFACYGDDAVVLVVDEFDAGIFEYLFGEIVEVLSKGTAGQLIFTSHNLRPLEILAPSSLILTTTDPENRYEFFKGLKASNNPRDVYLRNAFLHRDDDPFYQPTSEYEITKAFMKIGDLYHGDDND
jgi:predicted ATPase